MSRPAKVDEFTDGQTSCQDGRMWTDAAIWSSSLGRGIPCVAARQGPGVGPSVHCMHAKRDHLYPLFDFSDGWVRPINAARCVCRARWAASSEAVVDDRPHLEACGDAAFVMAALLASGVAAPAAPRDDKAAVRLLHLAAAAGSADAHLALADRYFGGRGVPRSCREGMRRATLVAEDLARQVVYLGTRVVPAAAVKASAPQNDEKFPLEASAPSRGACAPGWATRRA
jgi:hypothetical protein